MGYLSAPQMFRLGSTTLWQCHFDKSAYSDSSPQMFNVELPSEMNNALLKRKAEFLAGRVVAFYALHHAGCACSTLPIGENRYPVWPEGWFGSISHTDDLAIATVSPSLEANLLGIDVENLIDEDQLETLMPIFVNAEELKLRPIKQLSTQAFATLVFSAKESIFKALYPHIRTYLEFSDSVLTGIDVAKGKVYLTLCAQGEAVYGRALSICVDFRFEKNRVYTLVHTNYTR